MGLKSTISSIGTCALGLVIFIAAIAIPVVFIIGAAWVGERVLPWLMWLCVWAVGFNILILLPLAVIPRTRGLAGLGFFLSSYVFGLTGWFMGLLLTWILWGLFAVVVGLLILGVGVVPIAIVATLFNGMWPELDVLVLAVVLTYGLRLLGLWLSRVSGVEPTLAARDAFWAASDAYDTAFDAIGVYTTRANHRYAISTARDALHEAPLHDPYAASAYDEAVSVYTDPADFEPYTESYLDAHTAAINTLSEAFDNLATASAAYPLSAELYKAYCAAYTFAADAYSHATYCAGQTALEDQIQAVKDVMVAREFNWRATNPAEANPAAAKAKAAALEARAAEYKTKGKVLEEKAGIAETNAKVFLAKAKSAEARAEEALEVSQQWN